MIVLIIFGADAATLKCLYCFTPIASGSSFAHASNNLSKFDTPDEIDVIADDFYIEQVVSNYMTNAIKHVE